MKDKFPGLAKVSVHAFGQETIPAAKLAELIGDDKSIRLSAMNHPNVEGDVVTILKEEGRWTPEVTKFNGVMTQIQVTEPGPRREVIVAQVFNDTGVAVAQAAWVDEEGSGEGVYELRVREYAGGHRDFQCIRQVEPKKVKLDESVGLRFEVEGNYSVTLAIDSAIIAVGQLNRQSYRNSLFYFGIGPAVTDIGDGVASLNVSYLDIWHNIDSAIPRIVVHVKGRLARNK